MHVDDIIKRYLCGQAGCPNKDSWCWVVDTVHLKLLPKHMKIWSMSINAGDTTIDDCPEDLAKTLMPCRPTAKNLLRDPAPKATTTSSIPTPSFLQNPPHYPPYGPVTPLPYYPYNHPYLPPTYQPRQEPSPPSPPRRRAEPQASSPIRFENDPNSDKLKEYFDWLVRGYPGKVQQLRECLLTLKSEEIVYGTVHDIPNELWKDWKVPSELILMVKGHMKKWEREQATTRH